MLPSIASLARERSLLRDVLRSAGSPRDRPDVGEGTDAGTIRTAAKHAAAADAAIEGHSRCVRSVSADAVSKVAARLVSGDKFKISDGKLQHLPQELLLDIGEHFLESPVWHLCQLGEASPSLGKVFLDDDVWGRFYEGRFREVSRSPRRRSHSPRSLGARMTYAELHSLERRFREGLYSSRAALKNPRQGVAVLDLRIDSNSATAFAALRDGTVAAYDPAPALIDPSDLNVSPFRASPIREFSLGEGKSGGAALCCLPFSASPGVGDTGAVGQPLLAAGYATGRIGAWRLPSGDCVEPEPWDAAHAGRISTLVALDGALISASADGLAKTWDLGGDRLGQLKEVFSGHTAAVTSAAVPSVGHRQMFLTGGQDRAMRLWDLRRGGAQAVAQWEQRDWVTCVEFHPTSQHRCFSSDKCVHEWDLRRLDDGAVASSHQHRKLISRFRVDPLRLASCSLDGSVKVSSLEEPKVRQASPTSTPVHGPQQSDPDSGSSHGACTMRAFRDYVLCIDFDATRLLAGGVDGHVEIYDFSEPENFRASSPEKGVGSVSFSLSGMPDLEI